MKSPQRGRIENSPKIHRWETEDERFFLPAHSGRVIVVFTDPEAVLRLPLAPICNRYTVVSVHQHASIQRFGPFKRRQQPQELRIVAAARVQARTLQFADVIPQH